MLTLIIYEVKVAVIMAVFYLCYKLLLSHDTLHQFNRLILVFTTILSFVLPFCVITVHKTIEIDPFENFMPALNTIQYVEAEGPANVPYMDFDATKGDSIGEMPVSTAPRMPWWQIALIMAYLAGAVAIITKVIVELIKVRLIIKRGERHFDTDGTEIIVVDADIAPFSWMRWIVMSRADYDSGNRHIINHEKAHMALGHSSYVLAIDILSSMQWFNPVMWLLRADLRAIYEYEADDAVLRQGANIKEYQYSLIKKAVSASGYSITNSLNHSILKNRITMMSKSRTPMLQGLKALYIVPLVAAALATNAQTVVDYKTSEKEQPSNADSVKVVGNGTMGNVVSTSEHSENVDVIPDGKRISHDDFQKSKSNDTTSNEKFKDGESESNTFEIDVINLTMFLPFIITPDPAENIVIVYDGKKISLKDFKKIKSNKIKSVTMAKDNESDVYAKYGVTPGNPLMVVTSKSESEEQDDFWNTATSVLTSSIVNFLTSSYYAREDISNVNVIALTPQNIEDYIIVADGKRIDYKDFQKIKSNGFSGVEIVKGKSRMPEYEKYGVKENSTLIMVTLKE